jgi:hypothetical protein
LVRAYPLIAPQTAWLLGAGASAEAGMPTAGQLVDDLLLTLYCDETGQRRDDLDFSDPMTRMRVRAYYDGAHGLPRLASSDFYSAIFERVYPDREVRARYVADRLRRARPHPGHRVFAGLVAQGLVRLAITTNFDPLIEQAVDPMLAEACDPPQQLTRLDPHSSSRAEHAFATEAWPMLVKLHGDLGAVTLKNTSEELREQDAALQRQVTSALSRFGLIVAGYSGRDRSVMRMLKAVLELPTHYPTGLVWVHRPEDVLAEPVVELLEAACAAGVKARAIAAGSFVGLMTEIERAVTFDQPIRQRINTYLPKPARRPASVPIGTVQSWPQLRLAALPVVELPRHARLLEGPPSLGLGAVRTALQAERVPGMVARQAGGALIAFGDDAGLRSALEPLGVQVTDRVRLLRLAESADGKVDFAELGILLEALVVGLGRTRGLGHVLRAGQRHLVRVRRADEPSLGQLRRACGGSLGGFLTHPDFGRLPWAEAAAITLEFRDGIWWCLIAPEIWVRHDFESPAEPSDRSARRSEAARRGQEFIRTRVARRYNAQTGAIVTAWIHLLTLGQSTRQVRTYNLATGTGIEAEIVLGGRPAATGGLRAVRKRTAS